MQLLVGLENLILSLLAPTSTDETRGSQHCITVELTFLGRFDLAGEYIAAEKKVLQCPVDIRAVSEVDCLVLNVGTSWLDRPLACAHE